MCRWIAGLKTRRCCSFFRTPWTRFFYVLSVNERRLKGCRCIQAPRAHFYNVPPSHPSPETPFMVPPQLKDYQLLPLQCWNIINAQTNTQSGSRFAVFDAVSVACVCFGRKE